MKQVWIDLGELGNRALLFGGAYSNLQATQALLQQAQALGFNPPQVVCTGDAVAYCADPIATVDAIREFGGPVIAGNCERQLADGAASCGCGFAPGSTCDAFSAGWFAYADRSVDAATRSWMEGLPDLLVMTVAGRRCAVLHGGGTDISRFLWPGSADAEFQLEIDALFDVVGRVDTVVAGHCGLAFHRRIGDVDWINAGAIGMPPHDGRPETRFAVLTADGAVFHRLSYDTQSAVSAMMAAGLSKGYQRALRDGNWPSEDVLPVSLRRTPFLTDFKSKFVNSLK